MTRPAVEDILAGYTGQELLAIAERRLDAERRHDWDEIAAKADRFWTEIESDPDTSAAFDRLVAGMNAQIPPPPPEIRPRPRRTIRDDEAARHWYGRSALAGELDSLARALEGERNNALNRAAFRLGQLVTSGHLSTDEVIDGCFDVARALGLGETEIASTVRSGLHRGMEHPRP